MSRPMAGVEKAKDDDGPRHGGTVHADLQLMIMLGISSVVETINMNIYIYILYIYIFIYCII